MSKGISFDIDPDPDFYVDAELERQAYLAETHMESFQFGAGRGMESALDERD